MRVAAVAVGFFACMSASAQIELLQPPPKMPTLPKVDWSAPDAVARMFQEACLDRAGQASAVIDWALERGFEPIDPIRGSADELLSGETGTVLAAPSSGSRVLLAGGSTRCTVWVEGVAGGPVRMALMRMLSVLPLKGGRLQAQVDRQIEKAGSWRSQQQWRYRAPGAVHDLAIGAVTTLSDAPGAQAINMTPLPPSSGFGPDGMPVR